MVQVGIFFRREIVANSLEYMVSVIHVLFSEMLLKSKWFALLLKFDLVNNSCIPRSLPCGAEAAR